MMQSPKSDRYSSGQQTPPTSIFQPRPRSPGGLQHPILESQSSMSESPGFHTPQNQQQQQQQQYGFQGGFPPSSPPSSADRRFSPPTRPKDFSPFSPSPHSQAFQQTSNSALSSARGQLFSSPVSQSLPHTSPIIQSYPHSSPSIQPQYSFPFSQPPSATATMTSTGQETILSASAGSRRIAPPVPTTNSPRIYSQYYNHLASSPDPRYYPPIGGTSQLPYSSFALPPSAHSLRASESDPLLARRPKKRRTILTAMCAMFACWASFSALIVSILLFAEASHFLVASQHKVSLRNPFLTASPATESSAFKPSEAASSTSASSVASAPTASDDAPSVASSVKQLPFQGNQSAISRAILLAFIVGGISLLSEIGQMVLVPLCRPLRRFVLRLRVRSFTYLVLASTAPIAFYSGSACIGSTVLGFFIPSLLFYVGFLRGEEKVLSPSMRPRTLHLV